MAYPHFIDGAVVDLTYTPHSTMAPRKCEYPDCEWTFEDSDIKSYLELLARHCDANHPRDAPVEKTKPEKAKRPELASDISDEDWSYFTSRWERYKKMTKLTENEDITNQLLECCSDQVRRDHHRTFLSDKKEEDGLTET